MAATKTGSIADKWTEELPAIFHHLKAELLAIQSSVYFDPSKCITTFTDASGTGIAGVLMQDGNPVIFVSRTLSDVEKAFLYNRERVPRHRFHSHETEDVLSGLFLRCLH